VPVGVLQRQGRTHRPNPRYFGSEWSNMARRQTQKLKAGTLNNAFIQALDWNDLTSSLSTDFLAFKAATDFYINPHTHETEWWNPLALAANINASDNPRWHEAMNGPDRAGYWEAMKAEISTLTKLKAWTVVSLTPDMNVLDSTWAFKCKRYPDGNIRKFKARFCCRGDQQIYGTDYFDTFAPVVSWTTVRILLVLSVIFELDTKQVDNTCAFLHAPITENVYVHMPRGFQEEGKVLKLERTLYGLRQSPRNFFEHVKANLLKVGFAQSSADPCLSISDQVICLVYVDDTLFYSPNKTEIDKTLDKLSG